ncbi:MAG: DUF2846 domain-containing protein [Prevotella sp.]|nr:DUF2846 domain-containing protein [Prevotella sp.]
MEKKYFENREGSPRKALARFVLMLAVPLLLTNCGASKKVTGASTGNPDIAESPEPAFQLTEDCALLHIYRKSSLAGAAISYDLYLDNDKIFRATNKSKTTIKITKEGMNTLSAKTETKTEIPINIQFGNEYYIRCGMKMGALVGRPKIEVMDSHTGKAEFEKIPLKKK